GWRLTSRYIGHRRVAVLANLAKAHRLSRRGPYEGPKLDALAATHVALQPVGEIPKALTHRLQEALYGSSCDRQAEIDHASSAGLTAMSCPPTMPVETKVSKYSTFRSKDLSSFWVLGFTTASSKSPLMKWPADAMSSQKLMTTSSLSVPFTFRARVAPIWPGNSAISTKVVLRRWSA